MLSKKHKTKVKRSFPAPEPLPYTPGFKRLVPGVRCILICPERVEFGGIHNSTKCVVKECYKNVILIGVGRYYRQEYHVSPIYLAIPKRDGTISKSFHHNLMLKSINCMIGFPKKLTKFMRKESEMGRGDRKKRHPKKKRATRKRTPAERKTRAKAVSSKRKKKPKKKRITITALMYAYFDKVGLEKIKYERAKRIAQQVKPDTKFNRQHFSWYRNQYRILRDID